MKYRKCLSRKLDDVSNDHNFFLDLRLHLNVWVPGFYVSLQIPAPDQNLTTMITLVWGLSLRVKAYVLVKITWISEWAHANLAF